MKFRLYAFVCWLLVSMTMAPTASAQTISPLERLISVDLRSDRPDESLRLIEQQGRFTFSYNPIIMAGFRSAPLRLTAQPVRVVLTQFFKGTPVTFRAKGNHVILTQQEVTATAPTHFIVDGYIIDEKTGQRLVQASIYERTTLASAVSNPFGYYRLRLPTALPNVRLEVRKSTYEGETVIIPRKQTQSLNIQLRPVPPVPAQMPKVADIRPVLPTVPAPDTIRPTVVTPAVDVLPVPATDTLSKPGPTPWQSTWRSALLDVNDWFLSAKQMAHDINLSRDTLYREWQVSFLPFIGTNHMLSGRLINGYSLNVISGYSLGVRQLEVGGVLNMVRGDVMGVQVAGVGNLVGENVIGVQVGGALNTVRRNMTGVQVGGAANVVGGNVEGVQVGGAFNTVLGNMDGVQIAGAYNMNAGRVYGVQIAGAFNVANGDVVGGQIAGALNLATRSVSRGWQVSGLLNYAHALRRGSGQLGIINIADSSAATSIGILNIVRRNGYRRFELGVNETRLTSFTLKLGSRWFYNVFSGGTLLTNGTLPTVWQVGYGLGTNLVLKKHWGISVDATGHHVFEAGMRYTDPNWMLRFNTMLELRVGRLGFSAGPSLVAWHPSSTGTDPLAGRSLWLSNRPTTNELTWSHNGWTGWLGFQAGVRLTSRR